MRYGRRRAHPTGTARSVGCRRRRSAPTRGGEPASVAPSSRPAPGKRRMGQVDPLADARQVRTTNAAGLTGGYLVTLCLSMTWKSTAEEGAAMGGW
jgi:hypothetical protein